VKEITKNRQDSNTHEMEWIIILWLPWVMEIKKANCYKPQMLGNIRMFKIPTVETCFCPYKIESMIMK
jgi:hypothetical protein